MNLVVFFSFFPCLHIVLVLYDFASYRHGCLCALVLVVCILPMQRLGVCSSWRSPLKASFSANKIHPLSEKKDGKDITSCQGSIIPEEMIYFLKNKKRIYIMENLWHSS